MKLEMFQSLIGTIKTKKQRKEARRIDRVSIPYRDDKNCKREIFS